MDIDKANSEGTPTWEFLFDYKGTYGLTDMSPKSMLALSERFLTEQDTATKFAWNMHAQHGTQPVTTDQQYLYCLTSSSEMWENHECVS